MSEHDLILLATKYGSWFGNTLEIRKENLIEAARELQHVAYHKGYDEGFRDAMREQGNYQSEKP